MSLDVRPRWKQKDHVTTTVVVLHSLTPVMWQMNLHHMGNSTSFHIVVSLFCYELLLFLLILLQFFLLIIIKTLVYCSCGMKEMI